MSRKPRCARGPKAEGEDREHDSEPQCLLQQRPSVEDEPPLVDSEGHPLPEEALASDRRLDSLFSTDDYGLASMNGEDSMDFEDDSREIEEHLASLTDRPVETPAKKARPSSRFPPTQRGQVS